jgi:hypothetical protein
MARVAGLMQDDRTPEHDFPTLAAWGAGVRRGGNRADTPPLADPPHDRSAWVHAMMGRDVPSLVQLDNDVVLPFDRWLAGRYATRRLRLHSDISAPASASSDSIDGCRSGS